ncbi:MAG: mechanosensitive ion channel family protein, partial [Terriglobia bacterium]
LGVSYKEDIDRVYQVVREVGAEMQADKQHGPSILEPVDILGVDAFADSAIVIKLRIKTLPSKQWDVGREFRRRLKYRFDKEGIEIPGKAFDINLPEVSERMAASLRTSDTSAPNS